MKLPDKYQEIAFQEYFTPLSLMEVIMWVNMNILPEDVYTKDQLRDCFKRLKAEQQLAKGTKQ
jgi:hypothetical protein